MLENENKNYLFAPGEVERSISIAATLPVSDAGQMDIPAPETAAGVSFSVRASGAANYSLLKPTSRHFAEIFITVSAKVRTVLRAAKRFFRRAAAHLQMTFTLRRTVFLRL